MLQLLGFFLFFFATVPWHSFVPILPSSLSSNPSVLSFVPILPSSLFFQSFHPVFSSSPSIVPFVPIFNPLFLPVLLSPQSFRLFSSSPTTLSFLPSLLSGLSSIRPFLIFLHVPLLQPSFHCSDDPALCRTSYSQVCGRPPEDYCCLDPPVMGRLCWWASSFWQLFLLFWK